MTKINIIKKLRNEDPSLSNKKALFYINTIFSTIRNVLAKEDVLTLRRFGTFKVLNKSERFGRNPKTKTSHLIKARRVVSFKAGSSLKDSVKNS